MCTSASWVTHSRSRPSRVRGSRSSVRQLTSCLTPPTLSITRRFPCRLWMMDAGLAGLCSVGKQATDRECALWVGEMVDLSSHGHSTLPAKWTVGTEPRWLPPTVSAVTRCVLCWCVLSPAGGVECSSNCTKSTCSTELLSFIFSCGH